MSTNAVYRSAALAALNKLKFFFIFAFLSSLKDVDAGGVSLLLP